MQATIPGNRSNVGEGIKFPNRSGENMNSKVKEYTLSPEELEEYKSNTKINHVGVKQRNLTRWSKEKSIEILADLKLSWYSDEITRFIKMWNSGDCITKIAEKLKKDVDEIALLIIDQKRKGCIDDRPGGAYRKGIE